MAHPVSPREAGASARASLVLRATADLCVLFAVVVALLGCSLRKEVRDGTPPAPTPVRLQPPIEAQVPADPCEHELYLWVEPTIACAESKLSRDDIDGAMQVYDKLVLQRTRELWPAYQYADRAAEVGRSEAAARSFAGLEIDDPRRRIGEGVLAMHDLDRTGDDQYSAPIRRAYQGLLAQHSDELFALALALRYFIRVGREDLRALSIADQTCRERVTRGLDPERIVPRINPRKGDTDRDQAAAEVAGLAEVLGRCAEVALAVDDPGPARRLYAASLRLDPHAHATRLRWARMELAVGNIRRAAELFEAATAASSGRVRLDAQIGLGVVRARLGDREGAEQTYRAVLAILPRFVPDTREARAMPKEILFNLGVLLAGSQDPQRREEAKRLLTEFVQRADADELHRWRAAQVLHELTADPL